MASMFDTVLDLPVHILVVHAVVRGADIPVMTVRERRETPEQTD